MQSPAAGRLHGEGRTVAAIHRLALRLDGNGRSTGRGGLAELSRDALAVPIVGIGVGDVGLPEQFRIGEELRGSGDVWKIAGVGELLREPALIDFENDAQGQKVAGRGVEDLLRGVAVGPGLKVEAALIAKGVVVGGLVEIQQRLLDGPRGELRRGGHAGESDGFQARADRLSGKEIGGSRGRRRVVALRERDEEAGRVDEELDPRFVGDAGVGRLEGVGENGVGEVGDLPGVADEGDRLCIGDRGARSLAEERKQEDAIQRANERLERKLFPKRSSVEVRFDDRNFCAKWAVNHFDRRYVSALGRALQAAV